MGGNLRYFLLLANKQKEFILTTAESFYICRFVMCFLKTVSLLGDIYRNPLSWVPNIPWTGISKCVSPNLVVAYVVSRCFAGNLLYVACLLTFLVTSSGKVPRSRNSGSKLRFGHLIHIVVFFLFRMVFANSHSHQQRVCVLSGSPRCTLPLQARSYLPPLFMETWSARVKN